MKVTKISQDGIDLIKSFEGFSSKPYLCPAKIPTIGYGATFYPNGKKVTMSDKAITEAEAVDLLAHMLKSFEQYVDSYTRDDVSQHQFDALVSFAYNLGPTSLKSSTLLKKVNTNPSDESIRAEFMKWVYSGDGSKNGVDDDLDGIIDEKGEKKRLKGLVRRREAEANLYFSK